MCNRSIAMVNLYPHNVYERKKSINMTSKNNKLKYSLIIIGVVVVLLLVLVLVQSPTTSNPNASDSTASTSLVNKVASINGGIFDSVGIGSASNLPKPINGTPTTLNGKPQLIYIGAEYCPYCAAERWAMIAALSRFGTFSNLKLTHSSSSDVYPDTQTFSFHGATYTSPYLTFTPSEVNSNVVQGNGYATLDKLTPQEQNLQNTYDSPPYVASSNAGAIPFIYFGGKYLITGATYSPQLLQGKTYDQIASDLSNPSSDIAKAIIGSANSITAAICGMTNNQPSNVCNTSTIQSILTTINKQ
jgi:hypothetical protein